MYVGLPERHGEKLAHLRRLLREGRNVKWSPADDAFALENGLKRRQHPGEGQREMGRGL